MLKRSLLMLMAVSNLHLSAAAQAPGTASRFTTPDPLRLNLQDDLPRDFERTFSHHTANVNGIRMHYVIGGRGEPLVLMHGFLETWYTWRLIMPELAKHYTVIAPDLRGYGDSDKPPGGYDARTMVEDVYQLVQALGYQKILLVGHDMGAPPALIYAARHREDVRKLVYLEEPVLGVNDREVTTFAPPTGGAWWWSFAFTPGMPETLIAGKEREFLSFFYRRFSHDPTAISEATINEYLRTFAAPDGIRGAVGVYRAVFQSREQTAQDVRPKLNLPVLAVGGEASAGELPIQGMRQVATNVRGVVLPRCGHFPQDECPSALLAQLLPFLAAR